MYRLQPARPTSKVRPGPRGTRRPGGRRGVAIALQGLAILALPALIGSCAPDGRSGGDLNVVVILVDTLRADHLGCYGYPAPTSPAIDALAREGTVFTQAQAPASWTKPSIPSIFTGLYPIGHGVQTGNRTEGASVRSNVLGRDHVTMAEAFRGAGYATGAFVHNTQIASYLGFDQGFDVYREEVGEAEAITSAALGWIDSLSTPGPFFAYVHYLDPHWPYTPPTEFASMFPAPEAAIDFNTVHWKSFERMVRMGEVDLSEADLRAMKALYDGEIRYADSAIARLLEGLAHQGFDGNTLVVVTADHGEEFREHGRLGHGESLYDELLHVPLIFRLPGEPPRRVETPVELVDLLPTVLEAAGVEQPTPISGRSLLPAIRGESLPERPTFAHHRPEGDAGVTMESVRRGRHKLIRTYEPSEEALADEADGWDPPEISPGQWLEIEGPVGSSGRILALEVEPTDPEDFVKLNGPVQSVSEDGASFVLLGQPCTMENGAKIKSEDGDTMKGYRLAIGTWIQARGDGDGSGGFVVNRVKLLESKLKEEVKGPVTAVRESDDGMAVELAGFLRVTMDEETEFDGFPPGPGGGETGAPPATANRAGAAGTPNGFGDTAEGSAATHGPGAAMHAPDPAAGAPGAAMHAPDPAAGAPGAAMHAPDPAAGAPGAAMHAPDPAAGAPGAALHAPDPAGRSVTAGGSGAEKGSVASSPARLRRVELYDLAEDPREALDISERHPQLVAELGALLDQWNQVHGQTGDREEVALDAETVERLRSLGYIH